MSNTTREIANTLWYVRYRLEGEIENRAGRFAPVPRNVCLGRWYGRCGSEVRFVVRKLAAVKGGAA